MLIRPLVAWSRNRLSSDQWILRHVHKFQPRRANRHAKRVRRCRSANSGHLMTLLDLSPDFPKLAEKLSVIRTDRHENLVRPKNILPVQKKSPKKFTVTCIMFSLAFLEWFTLVLAIGHLISPLVFIEVKVIQFSIFSVVQNCIYVMSFIVCVSSFVVLMTLYYRSMVVWKTSFHWLIYIQITNRVMIVFTNGFGWNRKCIKGVKTMKIM